MAEITKTQATPDVEVVSGPTPSGSSNVNGHNDQNGHTADANASGEKRKAVSEEVGEGGKDLVEKKQTTLDDVVHHEEKGGTAAQSKVEEEKEEVGRPVKKAKMDTEGEVQTPKKDRGEKRDALAAADDDVAATPPSQKSQTDAPGDRPHKSVKKLDDLKEKPIVSTPTKSSQPGEGDVVMPAATSSPLPGASSGTDEMDAPAPSAKQAVAGGDSSTVPGDETHLDHPENWTTGGDPATDKQKGFLKVLEKQKGVSVGNVSGIGKSEASEKIDELKNM